jgi:hypothetical protein
MGRVCTLCGVAKELEFFGFDNRLKEGRRYQCKECYSARSNQIRKKSPEQYKKYGAKWREKNRERERLRSLKYDEEHREIRRAKNIDRYYANVEKSRAQSLQYHYANKDKRNAYCRDWQKRNLELCSRKVRERNGMAKQATPAWADIDAMNTLYSIAKIYRDSGIDCVVDHIVPINSKLVCGLNTVQNMNLISSKENLSKGNRHWPDMP